MVETQIVTLLQYIRWKKPNELAKHMISETREDTRYIIVLENLDNIVSSHFLEDLNSQ